MKTVSTKRFLGWVVCALLVASAVVPNALANPNPRITILFGGSFVSGERAFDLNGDSFVSQFLNGGKFRLRGSLDLTKHWTLEGDYSFGRNNQRITQDTGGVIEQRDFKVNVGQVQLNFVRFFTDNESRIRPFFTVGLGMVRFNPTERPSWLLSVAIFSPIRPSSLPRSTSASLWVADSRPVSIAGWDSDSISRIT